MKIRLSSALAIIPLLISASAFAQEKKPDPKFQIFLCFGQSNTFNTAGMRELGKRYAIQMLKLEGIEFKDVEQPGLLPVPAASAATPAAN